MFIEFPARNFSHIAILQLQHSVLVYTILIVSLFDAFPTHVPWRILEPNKELLSVLSYCLIKKRHFWNLFLSSVNALL